jgi:hypothetical protein
VNPLICIRGSASPGHSYPMTPLNVKNTGDSPMEVTYSANPAHAMTWLKVSPVEILPGESASIPVTLELYSKPIPRGASGESFDSVKYHDTPRAVVERQRPSRKNPRVRSKGFSGKRENRCATIVPLA